MPLTNTLALHKDANEFVGTPGKSIAVLPFENLSADQDRTKETQLICCIMVAWSAEKFTSPLYPAAIVCVVPPANEFVVQVATWVLESNGMPAHPAICAELSRNVTVPVGVPEPTTLAVTVAVNVTDWPAGAGFRLDARLMAGASVKGTVCVVDAVMP